MTIFSLMKMAESSPKWVENTVGKGQIARYEQFLLFAQCFQHTFTADKLKPGFVWERLKEITIRITVSHMINIAGIISYTSGLVI